MLCALISGGDVMLPAHHVLYVVTEKVTEIKTNIFVTSFGPVSDTEMVRTSAEQVQCLNSFFFFFLQTAIYY